MISCVMPTYRRMTCVERSINFFINQTHKDAELIVFNTDDEYPIELSQSLSDFNIKVINNNIDYSTGKPYDNVGSVRRDSLSHAVGEYYVCWDDDDIFLPWNNQQCIDNIKNTDLWAWKPYSSMASIYDNNPEISQNVMEASIISRINKIREVGYISHLGGGEHMGWYNEFERQKKMKVDKDSIPAYAFNWSDPPNIAGHKNSGSIKDPDNYNRHRNGCKDKHIRSMGLVDIKPYVDKFGSLLKKSLGQTIKSHLIQEYFFEKYVAQHL